MLNNFIFHSWTWSFFCLDLLNILCFCTKLFLYKINSFQIKVLGVFLFKNIFKCLSILCISTIKCSATIFLFAPQNGSELTTDSPILIVYQLRTMFLFNCIIFITMTIKSTLKIL